MSFIQQFFTSRDNNANAETFVGQEGRLWWDPITNQIYSSDGNTPGGIPLAGGGGGNGSPGGSNSQVQFNNSGTFGGSANLTFNRVSGALTAVSFTGDGAALSNITGANVVGEVSNATYASSAVTAISAETVTANNQPNITGVGILTSLSVSGNIDAAYFIGNGSQLTGIASSSSNIIFNGTSNVEIATADGNVTITAGGANTWAFDTIGILTVPTVATGFGTSEVSAISGSRKIVGSVNTWSTYIDGHSAFGALAWTASSSSIQSAKITFVVQTNGTAYNWEQFDVAICRLDGANAFVSVSGRVRQNSAIDYTDVSGYVNGGSLQVWLNPADGQTSAYVNYNSVEFNIMPD